MKRNNFYSQAKFHVVLGGDLPGIFSTMAQMFRSKALGGVNCQSFTSLHEAKGAYKEAPAFRDKSLLYHTSEESKARATEKVLSCLHTLEGAYRKSRIEKPVSKEIPVSEETRFQNAEDIFRVEPAPNSVYIHKSKDAESKLYSFRGIDVWNDTVVFEDTFQSAMNAPIVDYMGCIYGLMYLKEKQIDSCVYSSKSMKWHFSIRSFVELFSLTESETMKDLLMAGLDWVQLNSSFDRVAAWNKESWGYSFVS